MTFDLQLIYEHLLIYAGALALLFAAENTAVEELWKPFIHTLIDSVSWLKEREAVVKPFLVRLTALVVAYAIAYPLHEAYNAPAVVLGIYVHPALGVLPSAFIVVFFGRWINEWYTKRENAAKSSTPA